MELATEPKMDWAVKPVEQALPEGAPRPLQNVCDSPAALPEEGEGRKTSPQFSATFPQGEFPKRLSRMSGGSVLRGKLGPAGVQLRTRVRFSEMRRT